MLARNISLNGLLFLVYGAFLLCLYGVWDKSIDKFLGFIARGNEKIAGWIGLVMIGALSFLLVKLTGTTIADCFEAIFGFRFRGS